MISESELRRLIEKRFLNWDINIRRSGVALWVNLNDGNSNYFELPVTPSEGVGLSVVDSPQSDMSSHDEVFDTVESALTHIENILK
jgi:hypothetical protein